MESFICPENQKRFLALKAKEDAILRQYEYNVNLSKTMLINSNMKLKEQVVDKIKENEKVVTDRINIYQRNMSHIASEIMDKIMLHDDYEYINTKINEIHACIIEEFIQKYAKKLELFLVKEEKKAGNYYEVIKQKLETIILEKMSKIKNMEKEYIANIKEMYRNTMDELTEYKEEGLNVIIVEKKKCLKNRHLEDDIGDLKKRMKEQEDCTTNALLFVNRRVREIDEGIEDLSEEQLKMKKETARCFESLQTKLKEVCVPTPSTHVPTNSVVSNDWKKEMSSFYERKGIVFKSYGKPNPEIEKQEKPKTLAPFRQQIETSNIQPSEICLKDMCDNRNELTEYERLKSNTEVIRKVLPNYNHLMKIDESFVKFFEIDPTNEKYLKQYCNWRGYIKGKVTKKRFQSHDPLKALFEYTHKMKLWTQSIRETIENKTNIKLPDHELNEETHQNEALGVGYIFDDDKNWGEFDTEGAEIDSD